MASGSVPSASPTTTAVAALTAVDGVRRGGKLTWLGGDGGIKRNRHQPRQLCQQLIDLGAGQPHLPGMLVLRPDAHNHNGRARDGIIMRSPVGTGAAWPHNDSTRGQVAWLTTARFAWIGAQAHIGRGQCAVHPE